MKFSIVVVCFAVGFLYGGDFTDDRDHQVYPTLTFGDQEWFAKNLNFKAIESWCYGDLPSNCERFGRLYSWQAAQTSCPQGWHCAEDAAWMKLEAVLGMPVADLEKSGFNTARGSDEGARLREGGDLRMNLPMGGYRWKGSYSSLGEKTYLWAGNSPDPQKIYRRRIEHEKPILFRFTNPPEDFAISVRCVR